ncbi:MAG: hypothetical protein ACQ9MH_24210, partial [Nitrospinales bacterium]
MPGQIIRQISPSFQRLSLRLCVTLWIQIWIQSPNHGFLGATDGRKFQDYNGLEFRNGAEGETRTRMSIQTLDP